MNKSIKSWLTETALALQQAGLEAPKREAQLLLCHQLDVSLAHLFTWPEQELKSQDLNALQPLVKARLEGQPLAWLLGEWEFWGLPLRVSPATLIPRADSECLVETALSLDLPERARLLDLGTGTGALALALKSERPAWQVDAVDVQPAAVQLARDNARHLGLDVRIWVSDWWQAVPAGHYDLVLSNPPYIHPDDPHLQQGDLRYEPDSALVGGVDGLAAYRQLLTPLREHLSPGGWLLVEQGYDQAEAVASLFAEAGLGQITSAKDSNGQTRLTLGRF